MVVVTTGLATAVVLAGVLIGAALGLGAPLVLCLACSVAVAVAWVVVRHSPRSAVGPALAWSSGCVAVVQINDVLAASAYGPDPLPLASVAAHLWVGSWPVNLLGVFLLLLVFPGGARGGWWSTLPWVYVAATTAVMAAMWDLQQSDGQVVGDLPAPRQVTLLIGLATVGVCLALAVLSLVLAYRRGDPPSREQIRWLVLAGATVVVCLVVGWVLGSLGARIEVAYGPFLVAIVVLVPLAVGIAVVRYDLFDVDRLLGAGAAAVISAVISAGIFALVVLGMSQLVRAGTALGPSTAAFVTALVLLPLHRWVSRVVGRVLDRERTVALAAVNRFAADVSAGRRPPEEIEAVLRAAQRDPGLVLVLAAPDGRWVGMDGSPASKPDDRAADPAAGITVQSRGVPIARVRLTRDSARTRRRIGDLARVAWMPIEVCRLRLALREALAETHASRLRFAESSAAERLRWAQDLHDGAQQQLVAVGMRLRLLQRAAAGDAGLDTGLRLAITTELEAAVADLQGCVAELRRLAQGVRPARLEDGLPAALEAIRDATPLPMELSVDPGMLGVDETHALTAYLVVAEAVANVLKHADASRIEVHVAGHSDRLTVRVRDDGVGGLDSDAPLAALRDRVSSVGGTLDVHSPRGRGTTVSVVI